MKQIHQILLFLLFSAGTYAQVTDVEQLMTRHYLTCWDIEYNVNYLIPEFYEKNQPDTLRAITQFWEERCGTSEPLTRCKILLAIDQNRFDENIYDNTILADLAIFQKTNPYEHEIPLIDRRNYLELVNLNLFLENLANKLLRVNDLTPLETFFLKIYSRAPSYSVDTLQSTKFNGTNIQRYYQAITKNKKNTVKKNIAFLGGIWIPQEHLSVLGTHPSIGLRYSMTYKKLLFNATLCFKFINSPNDYLVVEDGVTYKTNHFLGSYIGLDMGYRIFTVDKNSFSLLGGIAYDGFDTSNKNENDADHTPSIGTLNLNAGFGYEFTLKSHNVVGIETKYNFLNFKNPGGTDLSGNVITINFTYRFAEAQRDSRIFLIPH